MIRTNPSDSGCGFKDGSKEARHGFERSRSPFVSTLGLIHPSITASDPVSWEHLNLNVRKLKALNMSGLSMTSPARYEPDMIKTVTVSVPTAVLWMPISWNWFQPVLNVSEVWILVAHLPGRSTENTTSKQDAGLVDIGVSHFIDFHRRLHPQS